MEPSGLLDFTQASLVSRQSHASLTPVSHQSQTHKFHPSLTQVSRKSQAPTLPPHSSRGAFSLSPPPRRKIYSDGEYNFKYYSGRRAWEVYRLLSPSLHLPDEYGEWRRDAPYPFSAPPDAKVP